MPMNGNGKPLQALLSMIDEPQRGRCEQLLAVESVQLVRAWGSSHNHQAWPGGYLEHVRQVMSIACDLHDVLSQYSFLPFSLSDALVVLFLHDIEKPWKADHNLKSKSSKKAFRRAKINYYGIELTTEQNNALECVEGEGDDYRNDRRVMNEMAAFCHMCDVASARIFYDLGDPRPAHDRTPKGGA